MTDATIQSGEPTLHNVTATICSMCLDGAGGECHTPGCAFIYHDGPAPKDRGVTLRRLLTDVGTVDGVTESFDGSPARPRIYVASKSKHGSQWKYLRDVCRFPIISTWIDEHEDGATADFSGLWDRCISEAASATAFIMVVSAGEIHKGSMVELGVALHAGVPVYWVGPTIGSVWKARGVTVCVSMSEALALAMEPKR